MLSVTFVRHGETVGNVARIIQSHTHGELTERGISMAEHLGRHLSEEKFTRVFSSDLKRCHDTTLHILKQSKDADVQEDCIVLDQILREMFCGDLEHQPQSEMFKLFNQTGLHFPHVQIPGGESFQDVKARTEKFFNMLCNLVDAKEGREENVLVVTHGAWLMCFLHCLVDLKKNEAIDLIDFEEKFCSMPAHNTATTKMTINKQADNGRRKVVVKQVHATDHLPEDLK
ncbi:fructose-2,6-bisphosphatase TIGAR isoform X1 [Folsomia candida]|uniref:fructose-2,6-bisphosphatase TIGAR isoform X1 n=1 Tax=Folsomia candida TaxID=158441 RepID=UPI0016052B06|nr:fructose-2,6-bisphosphatase TIGAR isoform X1 [Folsomia candida]